MFIRRPCSFPYTASGVHRFRLNAFQYIETDFSQIVQQKRYTATHMSNDCRNLLLNDAPQNSGVIILRIIIAHEYAIVNVTADLFSFIQTENTRPAESPVCLKKIMFFGINIPLSPEFPLLPTIFSSNCPKIQKDHADIDSISA